MCPAASWSEITEACKYVNASGEFGYGWELDFVKVPALRIY